MSKLIFKKSTEVAIQRMSSMKDWSPQEGADFLFVFVFVWNTSRIEAITKKRNSNNNM